MVMLAPAAKANRLESQADKMSRRQMQELEGGWATGRSIVVCSEYSHITTITLITLSDIRYQSKYKTRLTKYIILFFFHFTFF